MSLPINDIENLGEYLAIEWLTKNGFEVKRYSELVHLLLNLDQSSQNTDENEYGGRRRIKSLTNRLRNAENRVTELETSDEKQPRYDFLSYVKSRLIYLRRALRAYENGESSKNLEDIEIEMDGIEQTESFGDISSSNYKTEMTVVDARNFIGTKEMNFIKCVKEIGDLTIDLVGRKKTTKTHPIYKYDHFLIEIKTTVGGPSVFSPNQQEALAIGAKYQFLPKVIRVRLNPECKEDQPPNLKIS